LLPLAAVVVANGQRMATSGEGRRRPLLTIDEVEGQLGVSVRHVRRLVAERRIPLVKWGRLLRFDPAELEEWIEHARVPTAR
jgi:excisionase family DNA binding protein